MFSFLFDFLQICFIKFFYLKETKLVLSIFSIIYVDLIFRLPIDVPTACAIFPHEIAYQSESLVRNKFTNLIQFNHLPRGGHFAAFEEPGLLADDIFEFVSKVEDVRKKAGNKDASNIGKKIKEPTKI